MSTGFGPVAGPEGSERAGPKPRLADAGEATRDLSCHLLPHSPFDVAILRFCCMVLGTRRGHVSAGRTARSVLYVAIASEEDANRPIKTRRRPLSLRRMRTSRSRSSSLSRKVWAAARASSDRAYDPTTRLQWPRSAGSGDPSRAADACLSELDIGSRSDCGPVFPTCSWITTTDSTRRNRRHPFPPSPSGQGGSNSPCPRIVNRSGSIPSST